MLIENKKLTLAWELVCETARACAADHAFLSSRAGARFVISACGRGVAFGKEETLALFPPKQGTD